MKINTDINQIKNTEKNKENLTDTPATFKQGKDRESAATCVNTTRLKKESRTQHKQASQKKSETKQVKEAITDNKNATQARQRESARLDHDNGTRKEKLNVETSPEDLHASQTQKKSENQTADDDEIHGQTGLPPAATCIKTDEQMEIKIARLRLSCDSY